MTKTKLPTPASSPSPNPLLAAPTLDLFRAAPTPIRLQLQPFERVGLTLVGCGGTGSHLASGLAALALELRDRSIPCELRFVDHDRVEPKNVGRQLFAPHEVGQFKAQALAARLMNAYGITVHPHTVSVDRHFAMTCQRGVLTVVIGAVDNPAARAAIARIAQGMTGSLWWLDTGNENHSGQVALGNTARAKDLRGAIGLGMIDRLPAPSLVYPGLIKTPRALGWQSQPTNRPASCAELTATGEQSLMINRLVAAWALSLLYNFLIARDLKYFAVAFNARWGGAKAYTLDAPTLAQVAGLSEEQLQQGEK